MPAREEFSIDIKSNLDRIAEETRKLTAALEKMVQRTVEVTKTTEAATTTQTKQARATRKQTEEAGLLSKTFTTLREGLLKFIIVSAKITAVAVTATQVMSFLSAQFLINSDSMGLLIRNFIQASPLLRAFGAGVGIAVAVMNRLRLTSVSLVRGMIGLIQQFGGTSTAAVAAKAQLTGLTNVLKGFGGALEQVIKITGLNSTAVGQWLFVQKILPEHLRRTEVSLLDQGRVMGDLTTKTSNVMRASRRLKEVTADTAAEFRRLAVESEKVGAATQFTGRVNKDGTVIARGFGEAIDDETQKLVNLRLEQMEAVNVIKAGTKAQVKETFVTKLAAAGWGAKVAVIGLFLVTMGKAIKAVSQAVTLIGVRLFQASVKAALGFSELVKSVVVLEVGLKAFNKSTKSSLITLGELTVFLRMTSQTYRQSTIDLRAITGRLLEFAGTNGIASDQVFKLIKFVAALSAATGKSLQQAFTEVQSVILNGSNALADFGVNVTEATLAEDGFLDTTKKSLTAFTAREKAIARTEAVISRLSFAEEIAAGTTVTFAGELKGLESAMKDVSKQAGVGAEKALAPFARILRILTLVTQGVPGPIVAFLGAVRALIGPVIILIGTIVTLLAKLVILRGVFSLVAGGANILVTLFPTVALAMFGMNAAAVKTAGGMTVLSGLIRTQVAASFDVLKSTVIATGVAFKKLFTLHIIPFIAGLPRMARRLDRNVSLLAFMRKVLTGVNAQLKTFLVLQVPSAIKGFGSAIGSVANKEMRFWQVRMRLMSFQAIRFRRNLRALPGRLRNFRFGLRSSTKEMGLFRLMMFRVRTETKALTFASMISGLKTLGLVALTTIRRLLLFSSIAAIIAVLVVFGAAIAKIIKASKVLSRSFEVVRDTVKNAIEGLIGPFTNFKDLFSDMVGLTILGLVKMSLAIEFWQAVWKQAFGIIAIGLLDLKVRALNVTRDIIDGFALLEDFLPKELAVGLNVLATAFGKVATSQIVAANKKMMESVKDVDGAFKDYDEQLALYNEAMREAKVTGETVASVAERLIGLRSRDEKETQKSREELNALNFILDANQKLLALEAEGLTSVSAVRERLVQITVDLAEANQKLVDKEITNEEFLEKTLPLLREEATRKQQLLDLNALLVVGLREVNESREGGLDTAEQALKAEQDFADALEAVTSVLPAHTAAMIQGMGAQEGLALASSQLEQALGAVEDGSLTSEEKIRLLILAYQKLKDATKQVLAETEATWKETVGTIVGLISQVGTAIEGVFVRALQGQFRTAKDLFKALGDAIIAELTRIIVKLIIQELIIRAIKTALGGGTTSGGEGPEPVEIPGAAAGGIVRKPTLAVVGEAGPEAIIPLDRVSEFGGKSSEVIIINAVGNPEDFIAQGIARDPNVILNPVLRSGRLNGPARTFIRQTAD